MSTTTLTESSLTKTELNTLLKPWFVCFSAALFFFYEFIQMVMFNSISSQLMHDFSINATQLSNLSATFLYANVLFLLPAGVLLDRISVRKVIICGMILCIGGTALFASAHTYSVATIARFIAGIGNAFSFLSCIMLASRWFPPRKMALVVGLIVTFGMLGGVTAQTPLTVLSHYAGWRDALFLNTGLGVVILSIIWWYVQDFPKNYQQADNQSTQVNFVQAIIKSIKNAQNWFCGLYTSVLNFPIMALGGLWGSLCLIQQHHLTANEASNVSIMIFFGTIIGGPIVGWISDKLAIRRLPMIALAMLSIFILLTVMFIPNLHYDELLLLYLFLGIFTSGQIIGYPTIAESNAPSMTGTATGLAAVLIMGGGALSQLIFGWLLNFGWNGKTIYGSPIFSSIDITRATSMILVAFIIGLLCAFLIKETYCQPFQEKRVNNNGINTGATPD